MVVSREQYEVLKDHLFVRLSNNSILENSPEISKAGIYKDFLDLKAVVFEILGVNDDSIMSHPVTTFSIEGMSEEETKSLVWDDALKNTLDKYPPLITGITNALLLTMIGGEFPDEIGKDFLYLATNKMRLLGANAMLFDDFYNKAASGFGCDFYILPSSNHELILLPVDNLESKSFNPDDLDYFAEMVRDINRGHTIEPEDVLSDSVYYYDITARQL